MIKSAASATSLLGGRAGGRAANLAAFLCLQLLAAPAAKKLLKMFGKLYVWAFCMGIPVVTGLLR